MTQLNELLWNFPHASEPVVELLSIEKKTWMVTTTLLDAFSKYESPMMLQKTKITILNVLEKILEFIETFDALSESFSNCFETHLNELVETYLTNHLHHCDVLNVVEVVRYVYKPSIL